MAPEKPKDDGRPRGAGQRVVEQPRGRSHPGPARPSAPAARVGRAGTRPGAQGRPVPRPAASSNQQARERQRAAEKDAREADQQAADQEAERAQQAQDGTLGAQDDPIGDDPLTEKQQAARDKELAGVEPSLRDMDTSGHAPNESTRSQQPTNLESKGGTEQPHPTVSARAGKSSRQPGPPGRSHDPVATMRAILESTAGSRTEGGGIRVRATALGYYGFDSPIRRREGDVFTLVPREGTVTEFVLDADGYQLEDRNGFPVTREVKRVLEPAEQFSDKWMEPVDADEEERLTTAQQAIDQKHQELLGERAASNRRGAEGRGNDQPVVD